MAQTEALRKVTVQIPQHLLEHAQEATGDGITQTITAGLEKLAHSAAYRKLLGMKGSCKPVLDLESSRIDRKFE